MAARGQAPGATDETLRSRYLELMKGCLTRFLFDEEAQFEALPAADGWKGKLESAVNGGLARANLSIVRRRSIQELRDGQAWPEHAETMIGTARLNSLQECVEDALSSGVPGDLIETGVWRGGASIFMRAILAAWGDTTRRVWVADSFQGLPKPDVEKYPDDAGLDLWKYPQLAIGVEQVRNNFRRYDLLDDQVQFLVGFFRDTLATAPISQLAVMRLDGDLYESTIEALEALYPKLSVGGYAIIDDYGVLEPCRKATHDYRDANGIDEPIQLVSDGTGAFWKRAR